MRNHSVIRNKVQKKLTALYGDNLDISFPIPYRENAKLFERFLLMTMSFSTQRSRPFGMLTVDAESGRFLLLQDCHYQDFMNQEQYPFTVKLFYQLPGTLTTESYTESYHLLLERYDQLLGFVFTESLTKEQAEIVHEYATIFNTIVPEALLPFYQTAGSEFFSWIEKYA